MRKDSHGYSPQGEQGLNDNCSILYVGKVGKPVNKALTDIENCDPVSYHDIVLSQTGAIMLKDIVYRMFVQGRSRAGDHHK
jgi:hypothetical protein